MKPKLLKRKTTPDLVITPTSTPASPLVLFSLSGKTKRRKRKLIFSSRKHKYDKNYAPVPTTITRVSPFMPLSKQKLQDRWVKERVIKNPWGTLRIKGELLSVFDLKLFLAIMLLVYDKRVEKDSSTILVSLYKLCQMLDVPDILHYYKAIWESLERMGETTLNLNETRFQVVGSLLWVKRDKKTHKILIRPNFYFDKIFAMHFLTTFNYTFFLDIKGDVAKMLYLFLESQKGFYHDKWYRIHIVKLCKALNLETKDVPLWILRQTVRKAISSLVNERFLTQSSCIHMNDVVWFRQPKVTIEKLQAGEYFPWLGDD